MVSMQRRQSKQIKLVKTRCEICDLAKPRALHIHHIIPRVDSRCTNNNNNLAIVCAVCHSEIHSGDIIVIGVYSSSDPTQPKGRKLMWFRKGETPPLPEEFWKIHPKDNPLVVTQRDRQDSQYCPSV